MIALRIPKPRSRLQRLLALAVVLAAAAVASNTAYWRGVVARRSATTSARARPAGEPAPASSPEARSLRAHLLQNPSDFAARLRLSQLYFIDKEYPRALAELEILERAQPENPELFFHRAMVEKYAGRLPEAEQSARRALRLRPEYDAAREWLGEIYLDQGRSEEALAVFIRCLKRRPDSYFALMGKARALEQLYIARYAIGASQVVAPVEKAVQQEPANPWGVLTLARMKFNYLLQADAAEKLALRAAELEPHNPEPYIILAEIALHRPSTPENLRQAGVYAYEAAQRDPRDHRPPYQLGRALLKQNEPAEAAKLLERSVAMGASPEAIYQLSQAYRRSGNAERARYYGEIYQRWNDFMERRKTLLGNLRREPRQVEHYYALARLYVDASAPDPAENWLEKARHLEGKQGARYDRLMAQVRRLRERGGDAPVLPLP